MNPLNRRLKALEAVRKPPAALRPSRIWLVGVHSDGTQTRGACIVVPPLKPGKEGAK